jgi:hypothetical protein
LNLKDFFEFERLAFALNGQTHTHTKRKKIPMEKWEIPLKNLEDTSMGQNEPF